MAAFSITQDSVITLWNVVLGRRRDGLGDRADARTAREKPENWLRPMDKGVCSASEPGGRTAAEDPQVEAGSFRAVDVTALPDGRFLLATCCEPAAAHMYALNEDGHRLKDQDIFAEDAGHDADARVASGELVGLVIRPLSDLNSAAYTLALPPSLTGFSPDNISWAPGGDRIAFTIGGKLAVVDVSADSLAEATFVDPPEGSSWSGAAFTTDGMVAVDQGGDPLHPSGPSRLLRVDMETGESSELVPTGARVTDLAVNPTGSYLLWVEDGGLHWQAADAEAMLPEDFIAAGWMSAG